MATLENEEVIKAANVCGNFISQTREAMDGFTYNSDAPRDQLVRTLFTSSIDHSLSIAFLLSQGFASYGYSAMALFRPQLEAFARGVFFATPAETPDTDVDRFILKDELPGRPGNNGKLRPINLSELIDVTRQQLATFAGPDAPDINEAFRYVLKEFNGVVHGGGTVMKMYEKRDSRRIFLPHFEDLFNLLKHSAALTLLAMHFNLVRVCRVSEIGMSEAWHEARASFLALQA
jgi:hypothetical protein